MDLIEILKSVELFEGLNDDELRSMIDLCREIRFDEGEEIAQQNSTGNEMYIIQQGFVEVAVESKGDPPRKVIVNLGSGQTVGEMALLDQGPRSASVRAITTPTILQAISQADFEALCQKNTHIGYVVMHNIALDLSFRLRQRNLSDLVG